MQFHVARLLQENVGAVREHEVQEDHVDLTWVSPDTPVRGDLKLTRMPHGLLATGVIRLTAQTSCVRCLDSIDVPLELRFEEEFFPAIDVWTGKPVRYEEGESPDPEAQMIGDDHVIDLTDTIRQAALLAMELTPLCRPDCRGLCAECGANRNDGECACDRDVISSPFAVLRQLNVH